MDNDNKNTSNTQGDKDLQSLISNAIENRKILDASNSNGPTGVIPIPCNSKITEPALQTLKLLGVRSSLYVDESLSMLSGKTATAVFDFYESVIEADILNLTGIQVSLIKANGLRLSLNVCCKADLSALVSGDGIRCEKEDDEEYQRLVFEAKEGDRK